MELGTSLVTTALALKVPVVEMLSNAYDCANGFCDPSLMLPGSTSAYNNAIEEGTELAAKEGLEEATELTIIKPAFVKDANTFASWIKTIEHDRPNLTQADVDFLVNEADNYGVEVDAVMEDLLGHPGTNWPDPHIHFGQDRKFHVPVPKGYQLPRKGR